MKVIGLIGGMSWESTATYYRILNEQVRNQLGGQHSAKVLLYSVDFHEIETLQRSGQWDLAADQMIAAAKRLRSGGAECIVLCTNTMHKLAHHIEKEVALPFLHIADATAEALKNSEVTKVGLLGTRFTMEEDFYKKRITDHYGIEVMIPEEKQRELVHNVIFNELCLGKQSKASQEHYLSIIEKLHSKGAEAIILGCTEIGLLIKKEMTLVPLFDTTEIHARRAVEFSLS